MMKPSIRNNRRVFGVIFFTLLSLLALSRAGHFYGQAFGGFAWDFAINRTAAQGMLNNVSLYDRAALHQLAIDHIADKNSEKLFNGRFTSFVGLPTTAMLQLPFTLMSFESSVLWYRVCAVLVMLLSVFLVGCAVPPAQRCVAWLTGFSCLLLWNACSFSLKLGQVDAWVMLSLAATVLALSREKWTWAGLAVSLAVVLKISPAWLLVYCLIKRQWRFLFSASVCVVMSLLLSAWLSADNDLYRFFSVVLPSLGDSPIHPQNQSLGAGLARLFAVDNNLLSFATGIGGWKFVGIAVAAALLVIRCAREHNMQCVSLEGVGVVILCALIAGPLTWDHYIAWAIIPVVLLAARISGWQWLALLVVLLPMCFPVPYPKPDEVATNAVWRVLVMAQTVSALVIAAWLAVLSPAAENRKLNKALNKDIACKTAN